MLAPSRANMISTGMLMIAVRIRTPTGSAPGKATRVKKIDQARVEPIGAEMTALKMVASTADAERTRPVLLRTNSRLPVRSVVAMSFLLIAHASAGPPVDRPREAG